MKRMVWVFLIVSLVLNGCGMKNRREAAPTQNEAIESKIQSKLKTDPFTAA